MKKIMLISPKDNNFYNFRSELILKLKDEGNEPTVVCPYGEKIDYFTNRGCCFVDIQIDRRGMNPIKDLKLIFDYYRIIKEFNPDIVLTYTSKPSIYGGFICGVLKVPYIVNNAGLMETTGFLEKLLYLMYKIGFSKASCIMCQNSVEEEVLNKILKGKVYTRLIPGSGVNLNEFAYQNYPANDSKIVFNFVARIVNIKGINEYIECAKKVHKEYPETMFAIYGNYDDECYIPLINIGVNEGYLEYFGELLDIRPAICRAHALIHPSYYEGMTNVVLEHSSSGRPCIGSDIPGVADAIDDGVTGYVFECKNVDSLVTKVKQFLHLNYEEKRMMGRNARTKMEKEFDRSMVTNIYLDEVNRILYKSKGKTS